MTKYKIDHPVHPGQYNYNTLQFLSFFQLRPPQKGGDTPQEDIPNKDFSNIAMEFISLLHDLKTNGCLLKILEYEYFPPAKEKTLGTLTKLKGQTVSAVLHVFFFFNVHLTTRANLPCRLFSKNAKYIKTKKNVVKKMHL